jgi:dihydroorotate dehydrogenase electron transfer subunit
MRLLEAEIIRSECVSKDVFKVQLHFEESFSCEPGQFVNIKVSSVDAPLLRRPISISRQIDEYTIELLVKQIGMGTEILKKKLIGEKLDLIGPLGNGFFLDNVKPEDRILLIGGGIGIAPLVGLCDALKRKSVKNITVINGFTDHPYGEELFTGTQYREIDESIDKKYVTECVDFSEFDLVFSCGPKPMLKRLSEMAEESQTNLQISLEEKMACGIGVCLGCAIKIKIASEKYTYKKVCVDGPVFNSSEVMFDE